MKINRLVIASFINLAIFWVTKTTAQVVPDNTLGKNSTTVVTNGNNTYINGGLSVGKNLFESFQNFNLNNNQSAIFNASNQTQNIFSRVTGNQISNILGNITSLGNQNIFLLNPNGIIFGSNSSVNVNGSFFATTANSIRFLDGSYFNADGSSRFLNPGNFILTFNNSGDINVNNIGHNLKETAFNAPLVTNTNPGLGSSNGNEFGLFGANINFNGGILSSESSNIFIGAIKAGTVEFNFNNQWVPSFSNVSEFGNINLINKSLITTTENGSIDLEGATINLFNNSTIIQIANNTNQPGIINISASDTLNLSSTDSDGTFRSNISSEALGISKSASIIINAGNVNILDGSAGLFHSHGVIDMVGSQPQSY